MEYEVTAFEAGDFQDINGNYWCNAAFAGVAEPVRWVVKDPTTIKVGMKVYGKITDETSKAGKPYRRFRREKNPEHTYSKPAQEKPTEQYWDDKNKSIRAQWAIGQAVRLAVGKQNGELGAELLDDQIEQWADKLFAMVDRVANPQQELAVASKEDGEVNLEDIPF